MSPNYAEFMTVMGALARLVVLSIILERALAFIFEHDWFVRLTSREVPDPQDPTRKIRQSRPPGIKGILALGAALFICWTYKFDVVSVLFADNSGITFGRYITAVVAAGGSAGAIAVFQGFLNMSKDSRDALIAAKQADAEAARTVAESLAKEAAARKAIAEANKAKADAEKAEADVRKQIADGDARKQAAVQAAVEDAIKKAAEEAATGKPGK